MGEAAYYHKVLYAVFAFSMSLRDFGSKVDIESGILAVKNLYDKEM